MKAPLMQRAESIAASGNPRAQARFAFNHPRAAERTGMQPPQPMQPMRPAAPMGQAMNTQNPAQQMGNADAAMAAMGQMQSGQAAMPQMPAPRQPIPSFQPMAGSGIPAPMINRR